MTAMGKLLVFLVMILTIAWNALVVNAYVTRTNWRHEAKESLKKAKESSDAATNMDMLLKAERAAAADEVRSLKAEREQLMSELDRYKTAYKALFEQNQQYLKAAQDTNVTIATLEANIKKLEAETTNQNNQLVQAKKDIDELTLQADKDKVKANDATLREAAQFQRAERLGQRVQDLSEELSELKRQKVLGLANPLDKVPALPDDFRGTVTKRDGLYIEFTPGLDAGVKPGAYMTISRSNPSKFLGKLVVLKTDTKAAVGQFYPPKGVILKPEDYPVPGDILTPDR